MGTLGGFPCLPALWLRAGKSPSGLDANAIRLSMGNPGEAFAGLGAFPRSGFAGRNARLHRRDR